MELKEAIFLVRVNRFLALVQVDSAPVGVHIPNSGRLKELLVPGNPVILQKALRKGRKTWFDLIMVKLVQGYVSIDARLPNRLIYEALVSKELEDFVQYSRIIKEPRFQKSKLDFLLQDPSGGNKLYLEVKSVTLVRNQRAFFPDAPTERGTRHLLSLIEARQEGHKAGAIFVVQREDATSFSPNQETDPLFAQAMFSAFQIGIRFYAYTCQVRPGEVRLLRPIPLVL